MRASRSSIGGVWSPIGNRGASIGAMELSFNFFSKKFVETHIVKKKVTAATMTLFLLCF